MIEAIVVNRLGRWAYWKMRDGVALNFPSQVSFIRLAPSSANYRDPGIDTECLITQSAYEKIPAISQAVLRVEFISTAKTFQDKALLFGRSPRVYKECLAEAYRLLGDVLDKIMESRQEEIA